MRVRKKPVEVEAFQFRESNRDQVFQWADRLIKPRIEAGEKVRAPFGYDDEKHPGKLFVFTLEGVMEAQPTDWIICGVNGEFYPCKHEIFNKTYEVIP